MGSKGKEIVVSDSEEDTVVSDNEEDHEEVPVICDIRGGSYLKIDIHGEFCLRLRKLYDHWNDKNNVSIWGKSNIFVVETPTRSNNFRSSKSSKLHVWLFGLEFPDTTIVFGKQRIYYLCNTRDAEFFKVLEAPSRLARVTTTIEINSTDKDDTSAIKNIFHAIHRHPIYIESSIFIGYIEGELVGSFSKWKEEEEEEFREKLVDVSDGLSDLWSVKIKLELANILMCSQLNSMVMDMHVFKYLEDIVLSEKEVPHSEISEMVEDYILNPSPKIEHLKLEKIHLCHPPTIQSGGEFDLSDFATNTNNFLCCGFNENVILCGIGSSYDSCCSYLARTFLFNPCEVQSKAYQVLLNAQQAAMDALKPGHKLREAYESALSVVERENEDFVQHMTATVGAGIGLEFTETYLNLNSTNELVVKEGMAFKIVIGFDRVLSASGKMFSILLGDTVAINKKGKICVLTESKKKFNNVLCQFD